MKSVLSIRYVALPLGLVLACSDDTMGPASLQPPEASSPSASAAATPPASEAGTPAPPEAATPPTPPEAATPPTPEAATPGDVPLTAAESEGSSSGAADAGAPEGQAPADGRPLDLLFVIDNSISMADKQALLSQVGDVLNRFVHPSCVDESGNQFGAPAAGGACAPGQRLQFPPVTDVHLGVISTSLGDGGANVACPESGFAGFVEDRVDRAHLLGTLPRGNVPGLTPEGFVSFRAGDDEAVVLSSFQSLLGAVGEAGCGWEMPLEAWYRFLVDPFPYQGLERVVCPGSTSAGLNCVQPATDAANRILLDAPLLEQRTAFLRPDSRLGVVMLTDENDCSLAIGPQNWVVLAIDDSRPFFRGSSACEANPNDACCYSCPLGAPEGCAADPVCEGDADSGTLANRLPANADGQNLRCFQQKRRFGVDLLYPVARYINALTQPILCSTANDLGTSDCSDASLVDNPLFSAGRQPSDVFLAGILGVPSELLEARANAPGRPSLEQGFRYKLASELSDDDWTALIGDSSANPPVLPSSPFMIESALAREGVATPNPVNGREYQTLVTPGAAPDDLEYACIFPLPEPRDCALSDPATVACDCYEGDRDRPLCEQTPGVSPAGAIQYWGKAYPGTRQLEVLRGIGESAVVTSICAPNTSDGAAADFAYRPAIAALVDSMAASLAQP